MTNNTIEESLIRMKVVMKDLLEAVKSNPEEFHGTVALRTGAISLLLHAECENYGMTKELYTNLMKYSRKYFQKFTVIMDQGNFSFTGTNYNTNKQIVLNIGDGDKLLPSHIPPSFLPEEVVVEVVAEVGQKRKAVSRGPGREKYKSARACLVTSQLLSNPIIDMIEIQLKRCTVNKKSEIIVSALKSIMKKYGIQSEELGDKRGDWNDRIVFSLSYYLKNLQKYSAKFGSTESTIEKLLTATAVYSISDIEMSKIMGVSRRRISSAKQKRLKFDGIIDTEERNNEDSTDQSNDDVSHAQSENEQYDIENESDYFSGKGSEDENAIVDNKIVVEDKKKKKSIFEIALTPTPRHKRKDKLNLDVVRDFCHENCRLDTFSNTRILVRNYDDSHTYHDLHIRSKSLKKNIIVCLKTRTNTLVGRVKIEGKKEVVMMKMKNTCIQR